MTWLQVMAEKYENLIFRQTFSAYMSACQYLPMDFCCLSENPPLCSINNYQNTHGILFAFFVIRQQTLIFRKIGCFKKFIMADALS